MQEFPHQYRVKAAGKAQGIVIATAERLPDLVVAPPTQFDGPGDQWSPENLLMASLANCFVLSFRAIADASKLQWHSIDCESVGELDNVERKVRFTRVLSKVRLHIADSENKEKAERLLRRTEETCLISNSLSCESHIEYAIIFGHE
jgi:peroxiredoxin-like protein